MIIYDAEYIEDDPLMKPDSDEHLVDEFELSSDRFLSASPIDGFIDSSKIDTKSRCTYNADEKLEAIKYAEQTSNRQAAKRYLINESCIRQWRKKRQENLESLSESVIVGETSEGQLAPEEIESEECVKTEKNKRKSYSSNQKLEAINYAELVGNRRAARSFLVDESCIRKWRQNKELLIEIDRDRGTKRKPNLHWPKLEAELKSWVKTMMNSGVRLKPGEIRAKSIELAKKMNLTDFKGTSSYISKFMERYRISHRTRSIAKKSSIAGEPAAMSECQ